MAGSNLRKITNPGFLRSLEFGNLLRLLRKFDGYFKNIAHFEYEGVEQEQFDYDRLSSILVDQMMVGEYAELFNAFALIGAMSFENREDMLREFIEAQPYRGEMTDDMTVADLAMLVYLHDPDGLSDIDVQFNSTRKKSFAMRCTHYDLSGLEITGAQMEILEEHLNTVFAHNRRGKTAKVYPPTEEGDERWIVIRHGDSFKRQGAVDSGKKSKTLAFQPESFDLLVLNVKTGELRICIPSEPLWLEDCYAQALGKALFNDFSAFEEKRNNCLESIKELGERILYYTGDAEIRRLDLVGLRFCYSPDCAMVEQLTASAGNLFRDFRTVNFNLAAVGTILEAKFVIRIGDREKTIILKNNNRSGYEYDEFGKIIDEWLRAVGIIPAPSVMRQVA